MIIMVALMPGMVETAVVAAAHRAEMAAVFRQPGDLVTTEEQVQEAEGPVALEEGELAALISRKC